MRGARPRRRAFRPARRFSRRPPPRAHAPKLPAALAAVDKLKGDALLLLDIDPYLSNPVVTRALKELALHAESRGAQQVFTGHDIRLPDELAPYASRFELNR